MNMEIEQGEALFAYFGLKVDVRGLKRIRGRGSVIHLPNIEAYRKGSIYSDIADFFTTTVVEEAERIWNVVVSGVKALAKWVMSEVQSLWESAVDAVTDMADFISKFLKRFWNDVTEFVRRIQGVEDNVKAYVADATLKTTDKMKDIALGYIKDVLKKEGYSVDSMSEEEIREAWKKYMESHPISKEDEDKADDILNGTG